MITGKFNLSAKNAWNSGCNAFFIHGATAWRLCDTAKDRLLVCDFDWYKMFTALLYSKFLRRDSEFPLGIKWAPFGVSNRPWTSAPLGDRNIVLDSVTLTVTDFAKWSAKVTATVSATLEYKHALWSLSVSSFAYSPYRIASLFSLISLSLKG